MSNTSTFNGSHTSDPTFAPIPMGEVFAFKTAIFLALTAAGVVCTLGLTGSWTLVGQVILGMAFAHGVELEHQALHHTGFASKAWNRRWGFLFGLPMLVSFSAYQVSHLRHHQLVGTPQDKEFFDYGDRQRLSLLSVITHLFMLKHYPQFLQNVWTAMSGREFEGVSAERSAKMRTEFLLLGGAVVGALSISVAFETDLLWQLWGFPLIFIAAPIHALMELPEHYGCSRDTKDAMANTRTIRSNAFMTWFTNGNNYHVEHHFRMNVPIEKLPQMHDAIRSKIFHQNQTYREFYAQFLKDLVFGRKS